MRSMGRTSRGINDDILSGPKLSPSHTVTPAAYDEAADSVHLRPRRLPVVSQ